MDGRPPPASMIERVVLVLEAFGPDRPGLTMTEIARRTGLHLATTSRIVRAMVEQGLLSRSADGRVSVGVRLWALASRAQPLTRLRDAALPAMTTLQATIGHHTQLAVLDGDQALFVERLTGRDAVISFTQVAGRLPLNASSAGLVLLAHAEPRVVDAVLGQLLPSFTEATPTDGPTVRRLLAQARRDDVLLCRGFLHPDAAGLAAPVRDGGAVVAALSVIVPNDDEAARYRAPLVAAARAVGAALSR